MEVGPASRYHGNPALTVLFLVAAVLLIPAWLAAQQPGQQGAGAAAGSVVSRAIGRTPASAWRDAPPLAGHVVDQGGEPLANATVAITGLERVTTTDARGYFAFRYLSPGAYHMNVTLLGYAPAHEEVVVPPAGDAVRITVRLEPTALTLPGIQVTASPVNHDAMRATRGTVQLTGKELARGLSGSVAETLDAQPGITTRYAGSGTATPVIRGLAGERILVLQDGVRAADLSSTSADHGLSIDPLAASQIEVVRGPASLLYGNNALGGVVNVISHDIPTSVPTHHEGVVASQLESATPGGALSASLTLPMGSRWALSVRGGGRGIGDARTGEGGQLDNTDFRNYRASPAVAFIGQQFAGGVGARFYGFEYGLPAAPDAGESGVRIAGSRRELLARADLGAWQRGVTRLRLDASAQWYRHDEVEASGEVGTTFRLNTQTARLSARTRLGRIEGVVGASLLMKRYAPDGEEALTPPASSNNLGVFVYQEWSLGDAESAPRLQAGGRFDLYGTESEATFDFGPGRRLDWRNVSGSVGLNVPAGRVATFGFTLARAFRTPTVEELFSDAYHAALGSYDLGNPALEPEVNNGVEAVARLRSAGLSGQVSAFYNRIDRFITPVFVGDTLVVEQDGDSFTAPLAEFRQDDAHLLGAEMQLEASITEQLVAGVMGDLVRGEFVSGGPLPFMPAARLGGSLRWDNGRLSWGAEARHAFAQRDVPENELATDPYTLLDLHAGVVVNRGGLTHTISLRILNVTDELYREPTSRIKAFAPNPGRNVSLLYKVLF